MKLLETIAGDVTHFNKSRVSRNRHNKLTAVAAEYNEKYIKEVRSDLMKEYKKFKENIQNEIELKKSKVNFGLVINDMSQDSKEVFEV